MVQEPDQVIAAKYRLVRRLARGGMGSVWLARHVDLDTEVALKFLRAEQTDDDKAGARFRREARAAAALKSPNVVRVHDFGVDGGSPYIAMELLRGEDLRGLLEREGRLSLTLAKGILSQAAEGLRVAHNRGIVHRDIKPSNLFLEDTGEDIVVKLLDFGIAKGLDFDAGEVTTQGQVFGSPAYMSPEQARGGPIDARSDVWSLGAVFFEMVTGSAPFAGTSPSDVVVKLCTEDPVVPSAVRPDLPHSVDVFVRRALHRDATRRFQNVDEMMSAAEGLPTGERDESFPLRSPSQLGRSEETAPVKMGTGHAEGQATDPSFDSRPLRQSLVPARPPKSSARGVTFVGGVLALLGLVGLGMRREAPREPEPIQGGVVEVEAESGVTSPGDRSGPEVPVPVVEPDAGAPKSPAPSKSAEPQSEPGGPLPKNPKKASRLEPDRPPASTSRPSPLEPKADPVFGLPVESP